MSHIWYTLLLIPQCMRNSSQPGRRYKLYPGFLVDVHIWQVATLAASIRSSPTLNLMVTFTCLSLNVLHPLPPVRASIATHLYAFSSILALSFCHASSFSTIFSSHHVQSIHAWYYTEEMLHLYIFLITHQTCKLSSALYSLVCQPTRLIFSSFAFSQSLRLIHTIKAAASHSLLVLKYHIFHPLTCFMLQVLPSLLNLIPKSLSI